MQNGLKFKIQLLNALLMGKIRYNLAVWGNLALKYKNKVNAVILKTVQILTRNLYFSKSIEQVMNLLNIQDFFQMYHNTCYKQVYSNLNIKDEILSDTVLLITGT